MITDPACFLENSAFWEKTTTDGWQKYSSLNDVAVLNSVFPGCIFLQKLFLENYRSYNTSPGFDDTFIVIIIIMKFAHHIKKSRQHVMWNWQDIIVKHFCMTNHLVNITNCFEYQTNWYLYKTGYSIYITTCFMTRHRTKYIMHITKYIMHITKYICT